MLVPCDECAGGFLRGVKAHFLRALRDFCVRDLPPNNDLIEVANGARPCPTAKTTCPHYDAVYDVSCKTARFYTYLLLRNVFFTCAPFVCTTLKNLCLLVLGKPKRAT